MRGFASLEASPPLDCEEVAGSICCPDPVGGVRLAGVAGVVADDVPEGVGFIAPLPAAGLEVSGFALALALALGLGSGLYLILTLVPSGYPAGTMNLVG
mmetsp:Transcript_46218/g.109927  ORF Transcript_46218/g.109927 Transcript_46218/m.109927 type:complete len:99 (+) Transcript_46218:1571-1867(+)